MRELDADSPALDAVGVLGVPGRSGEPLTPVCTGTLLGPSSVLTVSSCWQALSRRGAPDLGQGTAVFAIGPDPREPLATAEVSEAVEVPDLRPDAGARDALQLTVLHLVKPLGAAPAAKLASASAALLGQVFVRAGYAPGAVRDAGQRRVAPVHLTALHGHTLEAAAANSGNNSEACRGPGEPLLRVDEAGELVLYGIASDVAGPAARSCDHGTVYTSFVSFEVRSFLEAQSHWLDPCGDLAERPTCSGALLRRCSAQGEGERRVIAQDCSEHGLICEESAAGAHCAPETL